MQYWLANPEEGCFLLCLLFTIKVMQKQASNRSKVPSANVYRASSEAKNPLWWKVQTTHCHLFQSNSALNKELQGQAEHKIMSVRLKAKFGLKHAMDHTTWLFLYGKSWSSSQLLNSFSDENCRKIHIFFFLSFFERVLKGGKLSPLIFCICTFFFLPSLPAPREEILEINNFSVILWKEWGETVNKLPEEAFSMWQIFYFSQTYSTCRRVTHAFKELGVVQACKGR